MTRREFIGAGLGISASAAIASPIRSTLGSLERIEAGVGLPYDSEVEYIESTGTQWIDTEIIPDSSTGLAVTGRFSRLQGFTRIGSRYAINSGQFCILSVATNGIRFDMGSGNSNSTQWELQSDATEVHLNARLKAARLVGLTGEEYSHNFEPTMSFSHFPILIFAFNNNGTPAIARGMVVSRVKISQRQVIIRDMIPVRFTNEYGSTEGAMYDLISGEVFRNKGSGAFIIGPDI